MQQISPDLVRAIFEARDHRHNETHAALLALWQGLVAELVEGGVVSPTRLGDRLARALDGVAPGPHGEMARALVAHATDWVLALRSGEAVAPPLRWTASKPPPTGEE